MKKILAIVGPTASGKSELAYRISEKIKSEIISADSRQIFKYLDIGTAKPTIEIRNKFKHHFVDELKPSEYFSAGEFAKHAKIKINNIFKHDKLPIIVGGTGLYISSLIYGLFEGVGKNDEIRNELLDKLKNFGADYLHNELKKVDPISAKKYIPAQTRFVVRAMEVFLTSGIPISEHHKNQKQKEIFPSIIIGLNWERKILYDKINKRVDEMIANNFIDEVKNILEIGYDEKIPALQTVGYKEAIEFLKNKISYDEFVRLMKQSSRRYAKRQMTWFRRMKEIIWFDLKIEDDFENVKLKVLKLIK